MIEVLDLHRHKVSPYDGEDFTSIEFHKNGIIGWVKLNYDDFYKWLKANNFHYYNQLNWKHFSFDKYSINEDFNSKKYHDRCVDVLNSYLSACDSYKPILDVAHKVDLAYCYPIMSKFHSQFFAHGFTTCLGCVSSSPSDYGLSVIPDNFKYHEYFWNALHSLGFTDGSLYSQVSDFLPVPYDGWFVKTSILYSFCDSSRKQELLDAYYKKHPLPEVIYDENRVDFAKELSGEEKKKLIKEMESLASWYEEYAECSNELKKYKAPKDYDVPVYKKFSEHPDDFGFVGGLWFICFPIVYIYLYYNLYFKTNIMPDGFFMGILLLIVAFILGVLIWFFGLYWVKKIFPARESKEEKQKRYQDYLEKKKEFEEKNQSIKDDNDENYTKFKNQLIALGPEPPNTSIPPQYHNPILLRQLVSYLEKQMAKSFNEAIKLYNRDLRNYPELAENHQAMDAAIVSAKEMKESA